MEADLALLEIFESRGSKRVLRPPAKRPGSPREAVDQWAQELGEADGAETKVTFRRKEYGHELYDVRVGSRSFSVIAH